MTSSSKNHNPTLILASGSPRRQELLKYLKIPFTVQPSAVSEEIRGNLSPPAVVQQLALRKADDIAAKNRTAVTIGADTIVVHDEHLLGKPASPQEAQKILQSLSGTTHQVLTGIALVKTNQSGDQVDRQTYFESTSVIFGQPHATEIDAYVATGQPMDKAGAYGIQDNWGAIFVKEIKGDYYNIVGLPLHLLYHQLKNFAPELFDGNC